MLTGGPGHISGGRVRKNIEAGIEKGNGSTINTDGGRVCDNGKGSNNIKTTLPVPIRFRKYGPAHAEGVPDVIQCFFPKTWALIPKRVRTMHPFCRRVCDSNGTQQLP